jgi:hypothetical protein
MKPIIGNAEELTAHFSHMHARGVERFYVWFADFAPVLTLELFADVINAV